jgi:hypothetical protein
MLNRKHFGEFLPEWYLRDMIDYAILYQIVINYIHVKTSHSKCQILEYEEIFFLIVEFYIQTNHSLHTMVSLKAF